MAIMIWRPFFILSRFMMWLRFCLILNLNCIFWNSDLPADTDNLCLKAFRLLEKDFDINPVKIHLLKNIPIGAGLGGGSSDASSTLELLNDYFVLKIEKDRLKKYAAQLGADCPFFIDNKAMYAEGIGTELSEISLDLSAYKNCRNQTRYSYFHC
ncbi:4-diphosphocytidyl-2-C-methyl-D-erythritol kinase [Sphingobacterium daejeonense]|nr:4-diphosphocytidyl-2-C-methyl-D-erythritol kinase [Sphingobacterium daejeonense]